jgi:predicted component of type VI protein secretion system
MEETVSLKTIWADQSQALAASQAEARQTILESKEELQELAAERDKLARQLPSLWPAKIAHPATWLRQWGLTPWRDQVRDWNDQYTRQIQVEIRAAIADLEWRLKGTTKILTRRHESLKKSLTVDLAATNRAWEAVAAEIWGMEKLLTSARASVGWLLSLPLPLLRCPTGWLGQRLPFSRHGTHYTSTQVGSAKKALREYARARNKEVSNWIPELYLARVAMEEIKVGFYLALVPRRKKRIGVLATQAHDILKRRLVPTVVDLLDVGEMQAILFQMTSSPEALAVARDCFLRCTSQVQVPEAQELARGRLLNLEHGVPSRQ